MDLRRRRSWAVVPLLTTLADRPGLRLDRSLAQVIAADLLIGEFGRDPTSLPPVAFDPSRYRPGTEWDADGVPARFGVNLVPSGGVDPWLAARVALLAPGLLDADSMRYALRSIADDPDATRDLQIAALAGLAALGEPVLGDLQAAGRQPGLTTDRADLPGARLRGRRATTRAPGPSSATCSVATASGSASGFACGSSRPTMGPTRPRSWPRSRPVWAIRSRPSWRTMRRSIRRRTRSTRSSSPRTPRGRSSGRRPRRPRSRSPSAAIERSSGSSRARRTPCACWPPRPPACRSRPSPEACGGRRGTRPGPRRRPARRTRISRSSASHSRSRSRPMGSSRSNLTATFAASAPEGCYDVVELVPSGLAPLATGLGHRQRGGVTWPSSVVGQQVRFCAGNDRRTGPRSTLRYLARVVNAGTFTWEPAIMQLPQAPELAGGHAVADGVDRPAISRCGRCVGPLRSDEPAIMSGDRRRMDEDRSHRSAGLGRRVRRLAAARRMASDDRRRAAGREARVRVALAVRSLPHGPAPDRRDHLRVVHHALGAGGADQPGPTGARRHLHGIPQPGPDGQDDFDDGFDQWRADGPRYRGGLETRRVACLRLRLSRDEGATRATRRRPGGHPGDARGRQAPARHVRRPLLARSRRSEHPQADPAATDADHGRRQRPERDLAARREARRRAQRRWAVARRGRRGTAGDPEPVRGDRARSGDAVGLGPHLERGVRSYRRAAGRPAGRVRRGRGEPGDGPRPGRHDSRTRRSRRWPRTPEPPGSSSPPSAGDAIRS